MESNFEVKSSEVYLSDLYPVEEPETNTNIDKLCWNYNIINEDKEQTNATTAISKNGQFDNSIIYSSDDIQKIPTIGDDNHVHHATTVDNNGEEPLATGNDNKSDPCTGFDNDHQKILEKNKLQQQLGDIDADYGPETCVDVTDDVVMMTENSADTNLLEQSALSHSKDTLPSSDNCNPFDNKNVLDMEDTNEYQLGSSGVDADDHLDDINKATPLMSPEMEDLPLSSETGLQYTNEGFQQSPLDDDIPRGIDSHQFDDQFTTSNGHVSLDHYSCSKEDVLNREQKADDNLGILNTFGAVGAEREFERDQVESPEIHRDNVFENNVEDEGDFRLKDEEELLEKHVLEKHLDELLDEKEVVREEDSVISSELDEPLIAEKEDQLALEKDNLKVLSDLKSNENPLEHLGKPDEILNVQLELSSLDKDYDPNENPLKYHDDTEEILNEQPELSSLDKDFDRILDGKEYLQQDEETNFSEPEIEVLSSNPKPLENPFDVPTTDNHLEHSIRDAIDLRQDGLQETLHSLEEDILENKPILTGSIPLEFLQELENESKPVEKQDETKTVELEKDNITDFVEEKFNRDELPEKEQNIKDEEVDQQPHSIKDEPLHHGEIELEDEGCIHLEEDQRPSEYLAMLERQKEEEQRQQQQHQEQQLNSIIEGLTAEHKVETDFKDEGIDQVEFEQNEGEIGTEEKRDLSEKETEHEEYTQDRYDQLKDHQFIEEQQGDDLIEEKRQSPILSEDKAFIDNREAIGEQHPYILPGDNKENMDAHKYPEVEAFSDNKDISEPIQHHILPEEDVILNNQENIKTHDEEHHFIESTEKDNILNEKEELEHHLHSDEIQPEQFKQENIAEKAQELYEDQNEKSLDSVNEALSPLPELGEPAIEAEEKQYFEESEKSTDALLAQETLRNDLTDEPLEEPQIAVCGQKIVPTVHGQCSPDQLTNVEQQILEPDVIRATLFQQEKHPITLPQEFDDLVEVVEEPIIKEQVPIRPGAEPLSSAQEPSIVPPTQESCDESEDDDWKYVKKDQGEKQLFGLQSDIVVEEQLQDISPVTIENQIESPGVTQEVLESIADKVEETKDIFENIIEKISEVAKSETEPVAEPAVETTLNDAVESLHLSQSSTREQLDNIEDGNLSANDMNFHLNPEAKEFIPSFTKKSTFGYEEKFETIDTPKAIPQHFQDDVVAQSPRKGRESNMENINVPPEKDFDQDIANKPQGDEVPTDAIESGEMFQEMNWKEAMHGSEKEEGHLLESPPVDQNIGVIGDGVVSPNLIGQNFCELTAPVDLETAGMKESIYIENNTSLQSNEDVLNTVQILPDVESRENSFEINNFNQAAPDNFNDVVNNTDVQALLDKTDDEKHENAEPTIEQKMEQLLSNYDAAITKEVSEVPEKIVESPAKEEPVAEAVSHLNLGAAAAVAVVATAATAAATAAASAAVLKKSEVEKNQKNLSKTSSVLKSKVPDTKKATTTSSTAKTSALTGTKRPIADKAKPSVTGSSITSKKTPTGSATATAAPRPRTAPGVGVGKPSLDKKAPTTSATKSKIDTKPPTTLASRKPLTSNTIKSTATKPTDDTKSNSSSKPLGAKTAVGSSKTTTKPRPNTASALISTNGPSAKSSATKTSTVKPSSTTVKTSLSSPRGTLTSSLRKTEAIKSPTKTTSTTTAITSRANTGTNGTTKSTTATRTTITKTSSSTVSTPRSPGSAATARRTTTGTTSTTVSISPTTKTNNLVARKSTPLKKPSNSSTLPAKKSVGSATKPTKDTVPKSASKLAAQNNDSIVTGPQKDAILTPISANGDEPKLNGHDIPSPTVVVEHPAEMEAA